MSELMTLYGCIKGAFGSRQDFYGLYKKNKVIIDNLPETDDLPPLTRNIFTVPLDYSTPEGKPGFYRVQMIHFGASFNNLSNLWNQWLEKFERLLKRLYWYEANIHLDVELYGSYHYIWKVNTEEIQRFYEKPPIPVGKWTFSGGPRSFDM